MAQVCGMIMVISAWGVISAKGFKSVFIKCANLVPFLAMIICWVVLLGERSFGLTASSKDTVQYTYVLIKISIKA